MINIVLILLLAVMPPDISAENEATIVPAQRKQYDQGNCYQWKKCRGDSIGNAWVHDPCFCSIQGGRSWMDRTGKCHDLLDGPFGTECR